MFNLPTVVFFFLFPFSLKTQRTVKYSKKVWEFKINFCLLVNTCNCLEVYEIIFVFYIGRTRCLPHFLSVRSSSHLSATHFVTVSVCFANNVFVLFFLYVKLDIKSLHLNANVTVTIVSNVALYAAVFGSFRRRTVKIVTNFPVGTDIIFLVFIHLFVMYLFKTCS